MSHIGYKKLDKGRIAKLEILGEHNEDREDIVNALYAKNRCDRAMVLAIYDMHTNKAGRVGYGRIDPTFRYQVGKTVEVDNYHPDHNKVCATGIHYFLSEEAAFNWGFQDFIKKYTGIMREWDNNGCLVAETQYENGKKNGWSKSWYANGVLRSKMYYVDNRLDGKYRAWHKTGKLSVQGHYKNGERDGVWKEWGVWEMNGKQVDYTKKRKR